MTVRLRSGDGSEAGKAFGDGGPAPAPDSDESTAGLGERVMNTGEEPAAAASADAVERFVEQAKCAVAPAVPGRLRLGGATYGGATAPR